MSDSASANTNSTPVTVSVNGTVVMSLYGTGSKSRAISARDALNSIFGDASRDLDFITPHWWNNSYGVISAKVESGGGTTTFRYHTPIDQNLYNTNFDPIVPVTGDDATGNGKKAWDLARTWAQNIHSHLASGDTNCLGQAVNSNRPLVPPTSSYAGSNTVTGTFYGKGEKQDNPTTANNEVFHTDDLTLATKRSDLPKNTWVRITLGGKSVVARVNDKGGRTGSVDLSYGGVAQALGMTGTSPVTISAP